MKRAIGLIIGLASIGLWARGEPLRLGIYDNPPMTFSEQGRPTGFIVDVIRDFARRNHYELQFVAAPFHELFDRLKRDEVDIIAPIAFNEERSRFLRYNSESILIDWSVIVIDNAASTKLLADLRGKTIGVVRGDHYAELFAQDLRLQDIACGFRSYDSFVAIVADVSAGKIPAGFIGRFSLTYIMKTRPRLPTVKVMPGSYYHEPLFFGIRPEREALVEELDAYLRQARSEPQGTLNRAYDSWFSQTRFQRRLMFLSRNYLWILLLVLSIIALFVGFNAILRRKVRRSVQEIHRQKTYFENLFQIIPIGLVILDAQNRVVETNREFLSLFGFTLDELKGSDLIDLINTDETRAQASELRRRALGGERIDADIRRRTKSGKWLDVHLVIQPIMDMGKVLGLIAIYLDISERKQMEEEIAKAKNIESVGFLAGGIAHDFNNMLTGILGNISVAKGLIADERARDILQKAEKASQKAGGLAQQLLTFSKGGYPKKQVIFLPDLVRNALDLVISGSNVRAGLLIADNIPTCEVDVAQVVQVIHNLLLNAREAMAGGGAIDVTVGTHRQQQSDSILQPGDYVTLSVRDRGPGIPAHDQQRLFLPYFTTKKTGSGLGLAIAYSIARKHDGHITVDSSEGQGATFTLYLPASEKTAAESSARVEPAARQARILMMDDEEIVREVFGDMLRDTPYRVDLAGDSGQALDMYRAARDAGAPYDLIFLDLTGPGDIGGIKTLDKIRASDPLVRAVAVSGYSVSEVSSQPGSFHFCDFLAKPFLPKDLLDMIARNLPRSNSNS